MKDKDIIQQWSGFMAEIKRLEELNSKLTQDLRYYHSNLTLILDELHDTNQRCYLFFNDKLDLPTLRYYEGQHSLIKRIHDLIDDKLIK